MKWLIGFFLILALAFVGWLVNNGGKSSTESPLISAGTSGGLMEITSSAFATGSKIPSKYTCQGENISPPLTISGAPSDTESLALVMDDPDAPGKTFVHWLAWNIPTNQAQIKEGSLPTGSTEGTTSFNQVGYGGPCPPSGEHRYFFKVFALNSRLDLPETTTADQLMEQIEGKILDQAQLMGTYSQN